MNQNSPSPSSNCQGKSRLHAFLPSHRQHEFPPGLPNGEFATQGISQGMRRIRWDDQNLFERQGWMYRRMSHLDGEDKNAENFLGSTSVWRGWKNIRERINIGIVYPWCLKIPGPPMQVWGVRLLTLLTKMKLLWKSYCIYLATTQEHPSFSLKRNRFPPTSWKLDFFSSIHQFLRQGLATFWDLSVLKK